MSYQTPLRKILHIDMDAFFASVEQRDFPELRGKAIAVGGSGERGVVAAASYEARKYGVFSAMSSKVALRKCPHLIFVKSRFEVYREVSREIRAIFRAYTELVEPLSLDEAYLDISEICADFQEAVAIAKEIKTRIKHKTQLTASAGVSINKFLAKIASDYDKPDGLYAIPPELAESFVEKLNIAQFHGVGKVTAQKMNKLGIYTGADLKHWAKADLLRRFGKAGKYYYNIARAIDRREVNPNRIRKSIGAERTFHQDLTEKADMEEALRKIAEELYDRIKQHRRTGKTLTLKVKFSDFRQITRSKTSPLLLDRQEIICERYQELLAQVYEPGIRVRLLGLQISNLNETPKQKAVQLKLDF